MSCRSEVKHNAFLSQGQEDSNTYTGNILFAHKEGFVWELYNIQVHTWHCQMDALRSYFSYTSYWYSPRAASAFWKTNLGWKYEMSDQTGSVVHSVESNVKRLKVTLTHNQWIFNMCHPNRSAVWHITGSKWGQQIFVITHAPHWAMQLLSGSRCVSAGEIQHILVSKLYLSLSSPIL